MHLKFKIKNYFRIAVLCVLIALWAYLAWFIWQYIFQQKPIDQAEIERRRFNIDQKLYQDDKKFLENLRKYQLEKSPSDLGNPFLP